MRSRVHKQFAKRLLRPAGMLAVALYALSISIGAIELLVDDRPYSALHWVSYGLAIAGLFALFMVPEWTRADQELSRELDEVIFGSRTGFARVPLVDLRKKSAMSHAGLGEHELSYEFSSMLGGVSAALARLARGPINVQWSFPFPPDCEKSDLVAVIMYSIGVDRNRAEQLLDEMVERIQSAMSEHRPSNRVEIFPIGVYQGLVTDYPLFISQPLVLREGYPGLGEALAKLERGGGLEQEGDAR